MSNYCGLFHKEEYVKHFSDIRHKKFVVSNDTWSLPNFSNQMIVYKRIGIKTIPRELLIIATILMGLLMSKNEKKSSLFSELSFMVIILILKGAQNTECFNDLGKLNLLTVDWS